MALMYLFALQIPSEEHMKKVYAEYRKKALLEETFPVEDLKAAGYTDEEIAEMRRRI